MDEQGEVRYVTVAPAAQLSAGERLLVEINGKPLVIMRIGDKYFSFDDLCTHDDGPLGDGELEGQEIICPRHGARFDIQSGKAKSLPAVVNINTYPVRIHQGNIEVGFSE
jgi:3-phenylpropionate/trans-cinnamate dioxygenase ferredoxin subunit